MIQRRYAALAACLVIANTWSMTALAEWKGKGELGLVIARGNTESKTISAKADMSTESEQWKHAVGFSTLYSRSSDVTTGNRYELHGQSDYKLSMRSYVFGTLRYEDDRFSPYSYQAIAAGGYGYKFIDSDATKLSAEIGAGYRRSEDRLTGEKQSDVVARGRLAYEHQLTATTKLYDNFLVESGSDNTFLQNELGVQVSMTEQLALSVVYLVRHNTDAQPPLKKTDQLLTANLVFSF